MILKDQLNRPLRDLRISVTDRCNFRCTYCMPKEVYGTHYKFMRRDELLSFEQLIRVVRLFAELGVVKVRITGGEPLARQRIEVLIKMIAQIKGIEDISLTTNASLLTADKARLLKTAGLNRLTVSLDALDNDAFTGMNNVAFPVDRILENIDHARAAGFKPIKINMVVIKGSNDDQVLAMVRHFRGHDYILRLIEYMDVGNSNRWKLEQVVPAQSLIKLINEQFPIAAVDANYRGEVAKRWRYKDGQGEIGFITSVSQPFCRSCTRLRLSAEGKLYTCLFATRGHDLRQLLNEGYSDEQIKHYIIDLWSQRTVRYSELRSAQTTALPKIEMSYIGG
ncbi:MAG: GTP 3',8-cyclase MoaA [Chromatiales bacterium]|nr:GTP 3',8-cyclase MoaA [Chromatiales bacterium]